MYSCKFLNFDRLSRLGSPLAMKPILARQLDFNIIIDTLVNKKLFLRHYGI